MPNLNRELWFATSIILIFVAAWGQPCIFSFWDRLWNPAQLTRRTGAEDSGLDWRLFGVDAFVLLDACAPYYSDQKNPGAPYRELMTRNRAHQNPVPGEERVLQLMRRALNPRSLKTAPLGFRVAIGDDAAIWQPGPGYQTVLTCDWFLQGTHFLSDRHPPDAVGWKCLARAVSDLAAMGAQPRCFLLSLALPTSRTGAWLKEFLSGLRAASQKLRCHAVGGDTTRRDDVLINITVVGECRRGRAVLRSGAQPGDAIFVSGRLGEAEYGRQLLRAASRHPNARDTRLRKHLYPEPRLAVGAWLAKNRLATAMMDLSDGLSSDLAKLCEASRVGASINKLALPHVNIEEERAIKFDATDLALHGGDDYELLFTVAKKNVTRIPKALGRVALTPIGEITSQQRVVLVDQRGASRLIQDKGWDPFR